MCSIFVIVNSPLRIPRRSCPARRLAPQWRASTPPLRWRPLASWPSSALPTCPRAATACECWFGVGHVCRKCSVPPLRRLQRCNWACSTGVSPVPRQVLLPSSAGGPPWSSRLPAPAPASSPAAPAPRLHLARRTSPHTPARAAPPRPAPPMQRLPHGCVRAAVCVRAGGIPQPAPGPDCGHQPGGEPSFAFRVTFRITFRVPFQAGFLGYTLVPR